MFGSASAATVLRRSASDLILRCRVLDALAVLIERRGAVSLPGESLLSLPQRGHQQSLLQPRKRLKRFRKMSHPLTRRVRVSLGPSRDSERGPPQIARRRKYRFLVV
jgi:hypothetical protein